MTIIKRNLFADLFKNPFYSTDIRINLIWKLVLSDFGKNEHIITARSKSCEKNIPSSTWRKSSQLQISVQVLEQLHPGEHLELQLCQEAV